MLCSVFFCKQKTGYEVCMSDSSSDVCSSDLLGHLIPRPPAEHIGERRLARAVRPHDRMDFARVDDERQALQDRLVGDGGVEVFDFEHGHLSSPSPSGEGLGWGLSA